MNTTILKPTDAPEKQSLVSKFVQAKPWKRLIQKN
jgi:hypothetical protein